MSPSRLEGLAYRMLGSVADAEDVVQEARLRLLKQATQPENEEAWLFRVVTNIAVDKLREQQRHRAAYSGPWLPEPLLTDDPGDIAELAETLSLGLVLMLERLNPTERAVFVLREGFDLGFEDIGRLLDASSSSCRQRFRRARLRLSDGERSRAQRNRGQAADDPVAQKRLLDRLLAAVAEQDAQSLIELCSDDCVALTDGGGVVSAAIRPIADPTRIAQVFLHLAGKLSEQAEIDFRWLALNGGTGLLIVQDGELVASVQIELSDGNEHIQRFYIMRNPEKLGHLAAMLK